ncbi:MAG: hypothetical protein RLZZ398_2228 [Verrucomicrobiota bacterium]|jgi:hypothetical protein
MSRSPLLKEDLELTQLREAEQRLLLLQKECAEIPKKLAQEQKDRECTMPPLADIADRIRMKAHNEIVSRGAATNIQRDQSRSLILLLLLMIATGTLIWWGIQLMQG